ncbi:DUF6230 family protein [Nocardioides jejuensis]|uniref:Cholesterol esterase n=1 Tax=Nocardioides jejuensis TaxID=2502782 RepID=A0A4R1BVX2_9ACTN|nr:DUF6230 family protein [Nocardioides jejuensis]TCJ21908.1 hypothetical protein EPD65_14065 [Nocardioides jejuensis]
MKRKTIRMRLADAVRRRREAAAARLRGLRDTSDAMLVRAEEGPRRGTRKQSAALALTAFAGLAGMFVAVSQDVLAVNFTTANTAYKVYTDKVSGLNAAGYINVQDLYGATDKAVAQLGFKTATLNGLCAIAKQNLPVLGDVSLLVTAGEPVDGTLTNPAGQAINAQQLYLSSDNLSGTGDQIAKLTLGQSADTLMMDTVPFSGTPGAFGLQAQTLNVSNLDADSYGIDLQGQINLPNLKIRVLPGAKTKADCGS